MSELPDGWCWTTVRDVTDKVETTDPKREPTTPFTYVDIGSIDNSAQRIVEPRTLLGAEAPSRARQLLRTGDTVFSTVRTYLRNIGYVDSSLDGAIGSTGFSVLRPAPGVNGRYLYYHSLTSRFVDGLSAQMRGTSYPAVVDGQVRDMEIPLAPAAEQDRIVAAIEEQFSRLDAGVAALERVRRKLKRMRAAVLVRAFEELQATIAPTLGGELFSFVTSGSRGWAKYYSQEGPAFLRIGNVPRTGVDLDLADVQRVTPPVGAEGRRTRVQPGDLLISITADLGRVAVIPAALGEAYINQHLALARPVNAVLPRYLAWYIASPFGLQQWDKLRRGATKIGLGLDDIRALHIPIPELKVQQSTVDIIEEAWEGIQRLERSMTNSRLRAEHLRSSVLATAFSGHLVAQDKADEPASTLLERTTAEQASSNGHKPRRGRKARVLGEGAPA